ncbi:hypothetical protein FPSE_08396 [Fusarium pseudograminearum CS3096]|uniref:Uncharacterized protein n=1 Tax=Fusarium pseudograminearum (strain CS3096) TaxID=1028729 RepID=K3VF90_FUSPC|nr:hypothetical protein FPSE_08396 [Fusarium pseudograminearum CS3096]EKJ71463.1 hypothetical protein FPSE_08396 [Fusarium pseudograminearum CS3096]KAF0637616.1 hypothetical protein FPSE5266_08396 [Fusarium pseudograminearum]
MRYSHALSGLLTVAMSASGFAQMTPGTTTEDFTTTGGMNVPTSVTSALPDTAIDTTTMTDTMTGTMTTMVKPTKTASPEVCCYQCTTVYDECCAIPGADIAICKEKYTICLGYNPWDIVPYVEPTVCVYEPYPPKHDDGKCVCGTGSCFTPDICAYECTTVYDQCCSVPGADIAICKEKYTVCLGYNPWGVTPYVKPSVCKHEKQYYIDYESKYDEHYFYEKYSSYYESGSYSYSSHGTSSYHEGYYTAEYCCLECTTIYDECCAIPGADIAICKEKYTVCLGYNPWDVTPYVKPSVCKHEESYYKEYETSHGKDYYNSKYDSSSHKEVEITVEECCVQCTTVYDECCLNGDIEVCKKEYIVCLGYNPWDVVPYVKPTVCKSISSGSNSKGDYGHKEVEVTVEECCVQCTTVYDECCLKGDVEVCKKEYIVCLGYNPWDVVPYVKPTVCKTVTSGSNSKGDTGYNGKGDTGYNGSKSGSEEECCVQCTTVYDECCSIDGHDIETCKSEYTVCLGYNPFDVTPYVKPTVCKHESSGSNSKTGGDSGYNGKGGNSGSNSKTGGDKSGSNSKSNSGSDEECCVQCTTVYKACCDASGAIIETCKEAYSVCLGYSPWDVTPYVEPTVCKHGKPSGDDVVIVSGGDRVRPVLALIAVGAFALLC